MFLTDVQSRLDVQIDDNQGNFYEMPNTSDESKTNENLNALKGCLSCSEKELKTFATEARKKGFVVPNKVLVLKNAKWLSFTFERCEHNNTEKVNSKNNPGKVNPENSSVSEYNSNLYCIKKIRC